MQDRALVYANHLKAIDGNCHQFSSDYSSSVISNDSKIKHSIE